MKVASAPNLLKYFGPLMVVPGAASEKIYDHNFLTQELTRILLLKFARSRA